MAVSSVFRTLLEGLDGTRGHKPHWPVMLRQLLASEYRRQQSQLTPYKSTVAIPRNDSSWEGVRKAEDRDVRRLYKTCEDTSKSILTIGKERFLLLGWLWPNQANHSKRQADFVGLNKAGGLVVFEAKGPKNPYSPLMAMLEGLDYLVHLTLAPNFRQIVTHFEDRSRGVEAGQAFPPPGFAGTKPNISACHEVIVIAPSAYFRTYARSGATSGRGHGWREFAGTASDGPLELQFRYAETDFTGTTAKWV